MEPRSLKERWGEKLTFWGGGVDTQQVLPFGTPEEVSAHIRDNLEIFGAGGGFVYSAVHNIQATVPLENLLAMAQALRAWR